MVFEQELKAVDKTRTRELSELFKGYRWNYLPDAIIEGYMGKVLADNEDNPQIVVLEAPSLHLSIIGGNAAHPSARKFIEELSVPKLIIFASEGWEKLLREIHKGKVIMLPRYAFSSENLEIAHLYKLKSQLPEGYHLEQMNLEIARMLADEKSEFSSEHMLNFDSPDDFIERGFGFCVFDRDEIASVATTFAICGSGIEIQVNTRKNHRGKGLATAVAAQLLIYSLKNNLDPNWDAANKASVGLAKKLGYIEQGTYSIHILVRSRLKALFGKILLKFESS